MSQVDRLALDRIRALERELAAEQEARQRLSKLVARLTQGKLPRGSDIPPETQEFRLRAI